MTYAGHTLPQLASCAAEARAAGRSLVHSAAIAERSLALPLFPQLRAEEQTQVIDAVRAVLGLPE